MPNIIRIEGSTVNLGEYLYQSGDEKSTITGGWVNLRRTCETVTFT